MLENAVPLPTEFPTSLPCDEDYEHILALIKEYIDPATPIHSPDDLINWIKKCENRFQYVVMTKFFGVLSHAFGIVEMVTERKQMYEARGLPYQEHVVVSDGHQSILIYEPMTENERMLDDVQRFLDEMSKS